jgi:hypothetical protein
MVLSAEIGDKTLATALWRLDTKNADASHLHLFLATAAEVQSCSSDTIAL